MRLYHEGDRGEPVLDVQNRLSALGFAPGDDPAGSFGEGTRDAVRRFQTARSLPVDGVVGPETWRALVDAGYTLGDRMLYHRVPMMRGDDVSDLQARLNSLGFDTGKVDGIFGPDTLSGVLDFQANRGLAEDGISGSLVASELRLVEFATQKHGREIVREHQWMEALPHTIAGQRIYIDAECRTPEETEATWKAAVATDTAVKLLSGRPVLSRSIDTSPDASLRAARSNRMNADMVIGFFIPNDGEEGVLYFHSEHSSSAAGQFIAGIIAARLDLPVLKSTAPMLKETRAPAALVSLRTMSRRVGTIVAHSVASVYEAEIPAE